ncbi:MAG TPA: TIM-barrel domain-containing protein [Alphaproteobacteria bacterium]|nr:TIM-barrel domain-containing protein [Alphaproteobacteria bacterium]
MKRILFVASFLTCFLPARFLFAQDNHAIIGNVRVELLSESLVRLELKGPEGFEDRPTFHIVNRDWPGAGFKLETRGKTVEIHSANYTIDVPENATSLDGVQVKSTDGTTLFQYDGNLQNSVWLPAPSGNPQVWSFADTPRIVPPKWGLTPAPAGNHDHPQTSGWDLANDAPDVYVFVPHGSYFQFRADFLKLTGPSEMPPLYAFGAFDSRWHDYSEATALEQIDDYRARQIPLDVLVVDTGWRVGASIGYQPNTNLFPNMSRFLREAHAKHVHVMFNDHPEPQAATALDPKELNYRWDGLTGLLNEGLDFWWFDRNWMVALKTPAPNLRKEVWGMRMYHDITLRDRPGSRPLIMANVDGIDNGIRNRPMDVASHRFSIQWTGDIGPGYPYLRRAVENAVNSGVCSMFPYESDDLGGHVADPTPEGYIRWIEYGALSPIYRPHCTYNHERMPWAFGPEAETVARRFLDMRYRLLPVFYGAAHENYETGQPLLRRLDLYYPEYPESARDDEYLLGKDILVAPVLQGLQQPVSQSWLKTPDGRPGLRAEYFANDNLAGAPTVTRVDKNIDFVWSGTSPSSQIPGEHFSARWTGTIEVPANVTNDVILSTIEDDGVRVWVDGKLVIDAWGPHDSTPTAASLPLTAGAPHNLRIEYQQLGGNAVLQFIANIQGNADVARELWIPPGNWISAWNGQTLTGPLMVTNMTPLDQEPIYIRSGSVVPLAPQMQYTSEMPWNQITLDAYPDTQTASATLYEDDTRTTAYKKGQFRRTMISTTADDGAKTVSVEIGAGEGHFKGALMKRAWIIRIHPPASWPRDLTPAQVYINGKGVELPVHILARAETAMPFGDASGAPDGDVYELTLPTTRVSKAIQVVVRFN